MWVCEVGRGRVSGLGKSECVWTHACVSAPAGRRCVWLSYGTQNVLLKKKKKRIGVRFGGDQP